MHAHKYTSVYTQRVHLLGYGLLSEVPAGLACGGRAAAGLALGMDGREPGRAGRSFQRESNTL